MGERKIRQVVGWMLIFTSININAAVLFEDGFSRGLGSWHRFGNPFSVVVGDAHGKQHIFDNNGDSYHDSGVFSKYELDLRGGDNIEADIYLDFSGLAGCWAGVSVQVSEDNSPKPSATMAPTYALHWGMKADGDACWGTSEQYRRHAWFSFQVLTKDGHYDAIKPYSLSADRYVNGWHKAKIKIRYDHKVEFYIDDVRLWTSTKAIDKSMLTGKRLVLGNRSSGSAGKAYHDNVKVISGPRTAASISAWPLLAITLVLGFFSWRGKVEEGEELNG